jgi:hypothetical protein
MTIIRTTIVVAALWSLVAQAADTPTPRQKIAISKNPNGLTISVATETGKRAPFPEDKVFVTLSNGDIQALISGQTKECVWDFPASKSHDVRDYQPAKHWCR